MKFDFKDSSYANIINPDMSRVIVSMLLSNPDLISVNPIYWPTAFTVDPDVLPTNTDGVASFTVKAESPEKASMMDMRAPLGEGTLAAEGEAYKYSGSIPDFISKAWKETAAERMQKRDVFEQFGDDAPLLKGYATNVLAPRIKAGHMALDYMAIQAETTGKVIYTKGNGIKDGIYKADIPVKNFHKAGAKLWTDQDCKLLDQMVAIEKEYEDLWGIKLQMQWKMKKSFFKNVVMKNKQVIETIKMNWLLDNKIATATPDSVASNFVVTEDNFNRYVVGAIDGLSPIKVVDAKQYDNGVLVDPWPEGIVTYSPAGAAGRILRANILDSKVYSEEFLNPAVTASFTPTADGLMTVVNYILPNGMLKEWQTKVVMAACPVITDFMYRVIVDTTTASASA